MNLKKITANVTPRTWTLATFLLILIVFPLLLGSTQKPQEIRERAATKPAAPTPIHPLTNTSGNSLDIYGLTIVGDTLQNGWTDKTWYGGGLTVNLFDRTHVHSGTNAISYMPTATNDSLELYAPAPFDVSTYTYLSLFAYSPQQGLNYGVMLLTAPLDGNGNYAKVGQPLSFSQYGGLPNPGSWTAYNFPVSALLQGADPTKIIGIDIIEQNNGYKQYLYLDDIGFSNQQNLNATQPPPQPNATVALTQPPGPQMPYYPEISPWVFIIPGIIIVLAILFQ